jgi:hypothetical protein
MDNRIKLRIFIRTNVSTLRINAAQLNRKILSSNKDIVVFRLTFISFVYLIYMSVPVAARSKAWVCSRSLAGTAGSNPTGSMDIFLL